MVLTRTHGIAKDSWYRISTPKSHAYKRAKCYPYVGFFSELITAMRASVMPELFAHNDQEKQVKDSFKQHFLAALSSSRSIVVCPLVRWSVGPSVHLCENVTLRLSNGVSE